MEAELTREETFRSVSAAGARATRRGEFQEALALYERAHEIARAAGNEESCVKAELNRAMVLIQMGEARRGEEGLRAILLRTRDPRIAYGAAYNLASSLRSQGRFEHAWRYVLRATENAKALGRQEAIARARNLAGNILLGQSRLDEALAEYRAAIEISGPDDSGDVYLRAILEENLGYCLLLRRDIEEGLERIECALTLAERAEDRRCRTECLQDLSYGLLLAGRHAEAIVRGEEALAAATEAGYRDIVENCHYLLGELGTKTEDMERRDRHFDALQEIHPDLPFLKDFLCAVDVTGIITLKR